MAKKIKLRTKSKPVSGNKVAVKVNAQFNKAQAEGDRRFISDLEKAKKHREGQSQMASKMTGYSGKNRADQNSASRAYAGKGNATAEEVNLHTRKESGQYNITPPLTGGTKQQMKKTKLRIKKNAASPQAKAAAKRAAQY